MNWQTVLVHRGYSHVYALAGDENARYIIGCSISYRSQCPFGVSGAPTCRSNDVAVPRGISLAFSDNGLELAYDVEDPSPRAAIHYNGIVNLQADNGLALIIYVAGGNGAVLQAFVNPLGVCSSLSSQQPMTHDQCSVANTHQTSRTWSGVLTISYDALLIDNILMPQSVDPTSNVCLVVSQTVFTMEPRTVGVDYYSVPDRAKPQDGCIHARLVYDDGVPAQRFVFGAVNGSRASPTPQPSYYHRTTGGLWAPLAYNEFAGVTFADAASSLLGLRDQQLKSVLPNDQMKSVRCGFCASFQTSAKPALAPLATNDIFATDLSSIGVDSEPFDFDSVSYPVDTGIEAIAGNDSSQISFTRMQGLTQESGVASDNLIFASSSGVVSHFNIDHTCALYSSCHDEYETITGDLYGVDATRSTPTPPISPVARNIEADVAFSSRSWRSGVNADLPTTPVTTWTLLSKYGTQFEKDSDRLDLALGFQRSPGYLELERPAEKQMNLPQWGAIAGYRSIGDKFLPTDSTFDPMTGLHGAYAAIQFAYLAGSALPLSFQIAGHQFTDAIEPRDTAVSAALKVRFSRNSPFALQMSDTTAALAVSQFARESGFTGPISPAFGETYLPNSSYSLGLNYGTGTSLEVNAGYTSGEQQNCNALYVSRPCFAYHQANFTGGLYWIRKSGPMQFFLAGSSENLNNAALDLPSVIWNASRQLFVSEPTTASHVVNQAALGLTLFNCAILSVTTANRSGEVDAFAASPPQPGYTDTYSVLIKPGRGMPALLLAYLRQETITASGMAQNTSQFYLRFVQGLPGKAFVKQSGACAPSS